VQRSAWQGQAELLLLAEPLLAQGRPVRRLVRRLRAEPWPLAQQVLAQAQRAAWQGQAEPLLLAEPLLAQVRPVRRLVRRLRAEPWPLAQQVLAPELPVSRVLPQELPTLFLGLALLSAQF